MARIGNWLGRAAVRRFPASLFLAVAIIAAAAFVPALASHEGGPLVTPTLIPHAVDSNPTCAEYEAPGQDWTEVKFDPPNSGTIGGITVTKIDEFTFNFSATFGIDAVVAKAGSDGHNLYRYDVPLLETDPGEVDHDNNLKSPGQNAISHISFCYDADAPEPEPEPEPEATADATACDPLGEGPGAITVSTSNTEGKVVVVTIDGAAGQVGSNDATAGDHTVIVTADGEEILNETVTVLACSSPTADASASTCDPVGAATGGIDVAVDGEAPEDIVLITIDGNPASEGNNSAGAGDHTVIVTVNGEEILNESVTVLACSAPVAGTSTTCDPFGVALGGINVSVDGDVAEDVVVVTIDGQPASEGNNSASAGNHDVIVTVNGVEILNKTETVAACSAPTAAASGACDPAGETLGTINVEVGGLVGSDTAAVTIDGQPAVVGSNAAGIGDHAVVVAVNGAQVLSQNVNIAACTDVLGVQLQAPQQPEVQPQALAAAQELPQTGPSFPVMPALLLSVILILLGIGVLLTEVVVAPVSLMAYVPKHRSKRDWTWPLGR